MSSLKNLEKFLEKTEADYMLLQQCDKFTRQHYLQSQLARYTGFTGSAGEAVLGLGGKIFLFVDPRYHIQADCEAKKGVDVIKLEMSQSFSDALKELVGADATLLVSEEHTTVSVAAKLKKYFNVKPQRYTDITENKNTGEVFDLPFELCGEESASKIEKVQRYIKQQKADGYLISNLEDIAYLLNKRGFDIPYGSVFKAKIYIDKDGVHNYPCPAGKKVIINPQNTSVYDFETLDKPVEIKENFIAQMASVKNDAEIAHLKECFFNMDNALEGFRKRIKAGLSEAELKEIIEEEIFAHGACGLSFKTILAVGENSSSIHYCASSAEKTLKEGDLILLDCGSFCKGGLATDITRTFVCGTPDKEQKEVYTRVLQAFLRAYNSKAVSGFELDETARNFLKEKAPEGFNFPHALGHGVGINVHQSPPCISPADKEKKKLVKGNVFTIEPGLYCEGKFGVRLENTVYINEEGKKISFSKFPFEQTLIDFELLNEDEKLWIKTWLRN